VHSLGVKASTGLPMVFQSSSTVRWAGLAERGLELGEGFLDGIEVWAVGRQVEQARAGRR
jgi:hypothetical protein